MPTFDRPLPDLTRDLLLQRFAPPAVLVNESGEILYVYGKTGQFLEPASGEASLNLFSMARHGGGTSVPQCRPLTGRYRT